jgi:hypothetical protein
MRKNEMTSEKKTRLMEMISGMSDDEVQVLLQKLENHEQLSDKRQYSRFPYTASVDFTTPTTQGSAELKDISIGGLFLEVDPSQRHFSVGNTLVLRVPYPNKERQVKIRGRIVRATLKGVGVEFEKKP